MKKNLIINTIKIVYLVLVFIISLFIFGSFMNQGNTDMTRDMKPASYPVISFVQNGVVINPMHGYADKMQESTMWETITPMEEGRVLNLKIEAYGKTIDNIGYELRNIDGSRLIENGFLDLKKENDIYTSRIALKDLIETDIPYMFVVMVDDGRETPIYYYSRVILASNRHEIEKLDYVIDFNAKTFDKEAANELTKYLESNSDGNNSSFANVNIHSSFNQVTWGDLNPRVEGDVNVYLRDLQRHTAGISLAYTVSVLDNNKRSYYWIDEYYRIRYTEERIYLLDFERRMNQIFSEDSTNINEKNIYLGISNGDISFVESDGGENIAFVNGNTIYSFEEAENKLVRVMSLGMDSTDKREGFRASNIKVLEIDGTGNIIYAIYGYMNRGSHEGQVGVAVYRYNSMPNTTEELLFIESKKSYSVLQAEVKQLCYLNYADVFFVLVDGTLYSANLESGTLDVLMEGLHEGNFQVSDKGRMIAYLENENLYENEKILLLNLDDHAKNVINANAGEYIVPLGFMGEDILYGSLNKEDIYTESNGSTAYPMYKITIQDENGSILKNYEIEDCFVIGISIRDNQITLNRIRYDENLGVGVPIMDDQIVYTIEEEVGYNKLQEVVTQNYETVLEIALNSEISPKQTKLLTPKEVLFEGDRTIEAKEKEYEGYLYYVNRDNKVLGIYTNPAAAVNKAYETAGVVMDNTGSDVFVKSNRMLKNQIMAIEEASVTENKNSLAVCLDTILKYNGISKNTEYLLRDGKDAKTILESNLVNADVLDLTGCSLDAVLYYVNRDIPVLATLNDKNAVLIIGFNELNTVLMNPETGTIYKMGINDSTEWFLANGNSFMTYIPH